MNRYPLWKYLIIAAALAFGALYSVPNFFGETPAVQVSSQRPTVRVDAELLTRIEAALKSANVTPERAYLDIAGQSQTARVRLADVDTQTRARDVIEATLNPDKTNPSWTVALNLQPRSPDWMASIRALPMYLGLDLRGGVHFLMEVNTQAALNKRLDSMASDIRSLMREKDTRHSGITRNGDAIEIRFRDAETRGKAEGLIKDGFANLVVTEGGSASEPMLTMRFTPAGAREVTDGALKQNITTLHNRINELGVSEPVIQQQGTDRVVVQLPGVQDTARAKAIIGRTATLEARLVDVSGEALAALGGSGVVPFGSERFDVGRGAPVILKRDVIFSGEQLEGAQATFDENQRPAVSIDLTEAAGRHLRKVSRDNIKKPMAVVLFERGRGEVLTVATIQDELGSRFRITGLDTTQIANDLALLLRAGALAAPMEVIEERTIGPSLGKENIERGLKSTLYGFLAIAVFMALYYRVFGVISVIALGVNVALLIGILSLAQATLTLPGIAAVALTLGMAIDANVLVNERVREELRRGRTPQQAIAEGYDKAWATIIDSNITTLIAGVFLFALGSGPIRGFAVVHCLGILTSIFSAVFVSRGFVNLVYGSRRKLSSISVGQVWRPDAAAAVGAAGK
jgi:preprotein translocase subunit SecD